MTSDSLNGWKHSIWSGWPEFSNNVLIRLAKLEGKFHSGLPRLPCPSKSAWSCLSRSIHCQAMTKESPGFFFFFFNWMEDFKIWLGGCYDKKCGHKIIVGVWEWERVKAKGGRSLLPARQEGREASRGFRRQPHSLAGLWLPWKWYSQFKPRVTLGKDWLESHLMQNSATTWFSQRFTSDESLAPNGTRSFWACQHQPWSFLLKNDTCLTYEKFLPSCLHQVPVATRKYLLYPWATPVGSHGHTAAFLRHCWSYSVGVSLLKL